MSLILLLDLDDTLLENNIDTFLPHYLRAFAGEVTPYVDPNKFVKTLLEGTQAMVDNRRPDCTLKEAFESKFFPALGVDASQFQGLADKFYAEIFPSLRGLTRPIPEAIRLIEQAMARGYRLAIATNPLFPLTAVLQRLSWADLPAEKYPFEVIASYETFHFTKPDPAYFIEVLGRMGWPSGAVGIVGNDLEREIIPGIKLRIPAFWISQPGVPPPAGDGTPTSSGTLEDVLPWIDDISIELIQPEYETPYAMLAILRATPAILDSTCRCLPDVIKGARPSRDEWSVTEILCHLRDVDMEVNLPRLNKVLHEVNPFLPGEDTDPWAKDRNYILQDCDEALDRFIITRMEIVSMLETLSPDDWERSARHAIFGPTRLIELVKIITGHDRLHVQQAHEVLGVMSDPAQICDFMK